MTRQEYETAIDRTAGLRGSVVGRSRRCVMGVACGVQVWGKAGVAMWCVSACGRVSKWCGVWMENTEIETEEGAWWQVMACGEGRERSDGRGEEEPSPPPPPPPPPPLPPPPLSLKEGRRTANGDRLSPPPPSLPLSSLPLSLPLSSSLLLGRVAGREGTGGGGRRKDTQV